MVYNLSEEQKKYIISGQYVKDIKTQYKFILSVLSRMKITDKSAIVLDLDETIFSDLCEETITVDGKRVRVGEFFDKKYIHNSPYHPIIPGAETFYKKLHKLVNGNIFIVSARDKSAEKTTRENMDMYNLKFKEIYLRNKSDSDIAKFKSTARKAISKKYKIIGSIGDQPGDVGEHTIHNFLLVNPFYKTT